MNAPQQLELVKQDPIWAPEPGQVCLNLGSGTKQIEGYIGVDIRPGPGVSIVADLEKRWPWEDGTIDHIMAHDLPEHLRGWYETPGDSIHEAKRVMETDPVGALALVIEAIEKPKRTYGILHFMNEAQRILKMKGTLDIWVPTTDGRGWAQDPTHVSHWNVNTFMYFCNVNFRQDLTTKVHGFWLPIILKTSPMDGLGVRWVRAILEKVTEEEYEHERRS